VVNTLATNAPTWLIQFPSLVRPEQKAALQREILGATRERMVRELCEALEVITETAPLGLILEDLHWVDRSALDIISAIARRREPAKLLVVGTFCPADLILSQSPLKALKQDLLLHRLSHEVELERLRESDVADYVAAEFAPGDLPTDPRLRAALTLALTGSEHEAETIANELVVTNPEHTLVNSVLVPIVWAGIELARNRPEQAIEHLQVVAQSRSSAPAWNRRADVMEHGCGP